MSNESAQDERPAVWVGHIVLQVPDVDHAHAFFSKLGMRSLGHDAPVALLELRGGTHLVLLPGGAHADGKEAPFDLMVDDLEASRAAYASAGLRPSEIAKNQFHRYFTLGLPTGHVLTVNSSHVSGKAV